MPAPGTYRGPVKTPPDERTYDNADDWADLLNEAGIYKTELEGDNSFAELRVGRMDGPCIVQVVGSTPGRNGVDRYEVYPLLLLPPGFVWPLLESPDPVAAELRKRFYLD